MELTKKEGGFGLRGMGAFYYLFEVFYSIAFVCQYTYNATQTTFKK
jgi:hypothetical protein